ncbi:MAG: hypothetical protein WBE79_14460 [Candidatus Cybelea sp.]
MAVGDQFTHIYEFAISGTRGTSVWATNLGSGAMYVKQTWIQGPTLIAPNVYIKKHQPKSSNVLFYAYPTGGKATKTVTKGIEDAQAAVVSLAAK